MNEVKTESHLIDKIIGIKNNANLTQDPHYCIKWKGIGYIHCSYLIEEQIILISGGKSAIEEFQSRSNQDFKPISANFPIPDLMIREDLEILADYFEHK